MDHQEAAAQARRMQQAHNLLRKALPAPRSIHG